MNIEEKSPKKHFSIAPAAAELRTHQRNARHHLSSILRLVAPPDQSQQNE